MLFRMCIDNDGIRYSLERENAIMNGSLEIKDKDCTATGEKYCTAVH
jgi:hypothetical protein